MTLDEQIAILQAAKEGKKIRIRTASHSAILSSNESHLFDFVSGEYEIQREPMESWAVVFPTTWVEHFATKENAIENCPPAGRVAKFREVLED